MRGMLQDFLPGWRIAYFSMEIALRAEIPSYSGGLGVLAGDTVRTAADLEVPMVAVSLVSRRGYFRQTIDAQGRQVEHPDPWEPERFAAPLEAKVTVPCEGRRVWVGGWRSASALVSPKLWDRFVFPYLHQMVTALADIQAAVDEALSRLPVVS